MFMDKFLANLQNLKSQKCNFVQKDEKTANILYKYKIQTFPRGDKRRPDKKKRP